MKIYIDLFFLLWYSYNTCLLELNKKNRSVSGNYGENIKK